MKRIAPLMGLLLGVLFLTPAVASAHTANIIIKCPDPGSSTASVQFNWQNFPNQWNVVNADVTLDTITVAGSGKAGFQGASGSKTFLVPVAADGRPHTIVATTSWTQDGGGRSQRTATCTVPVPPPTPVPPTPVPPTPVPPTPVPPTPVPPSPESECHLGTVCCPVCVTQRQRDLLIGSTRISARTNLTTRYERIRSGTVTYIAPRADVMEANRVKFGVAFDPVGRRVTVPLRRRADGRLTVHIDQRGLLAVRGQYFNASLRLRTVSGKVRNERRNWRLCMIGDGELDVPSNRLRD